MGLLRNYDNGWTIRRSILGSDGITQSELSEMKIKWSHTFVLLHVHHKVQEVSTLKTSSRAV